MNLFELRTEVTKLFDNLSTQDLIESLRAMGYTVEKTGEPIKATSINGMGDGVIEGNSWVFEKTPESKKEVDWKILSFKMFNTTLFTLMDWEKYSCYSQPHFETEYGGNQVSQEDALAHKGMKIHSIMRLSDNNTFTVGDLVLGGKNMAIGEKIEEIVLNEHNHILIVTQQYKKGIQLKKISHVLPDKLTVRKGAFVLKTEDGTLITDPEQDIYSVRLPKREVMPKATAKAVLSLRDNYVFFSTREAMNRWLATGSAYVFTTEDGVQISNRGQNLYYLNPTTGYTSISCINNKNEKGLLFSTAEARNKYMCMNNKLFSINDLKKHVPEWAWPAFREKFENIALNRNDKI